MKQQLLLTAGAPDPKDYGQIRIEQRYTRSTSEYPQGSYLYIVAGNVEIATGHFAKEYPNKPSPYWHGGAPFVVLSIDEWPWDDWRKR